MITKPDSVSSNLFILDRDGNIRATQPLTGVPAAIAVDNQENIYIAGRAVNGFTGRRLPDETKFGRNADLSNAPRRPPRG
ncbi:MAG: hypothetical protein HYX27_06900 [Acidobacteria bacterium]|nr:hypothetical protein [Acidobacteriota bacterium]